MMDMEIEVEAIAPTGALAIADIRPWRDATGDDVRIGIASKIYRTAHHWVAILTEAEADFFDEQIAAGAS